MKEVINVHLPSIRVVEVDKKLVGEVISIMLDELGLKYNDLYTRRRFGNLIENRRLFFYVLRMYTPFTCKEIGKKIGFHYSSVIYHTKRMKDFLSIPGERDKYLPKINRLVSIVQSILNEEAS